MNSKVTLKKIDGQGLKVEVTVTYKKRFRKTYAYKNPIATQKIVCKFVYETKEETPEMLIALISSRKLRDILSAAKNLKKLQAVCSMSPWRQARERDIYGQGLFKGLAKRHIK